MATVSPAHRLSPNFRLGEFTGGQPLDEESVVLDALSRLTRQFLQPLRDEFGLTRIHSGWRSDERNRAVGGAPQSRHMYHRYPHQVAADLSCARGTPRDWYRFLDARGVPGLGAYVSHVHADLGPRRRW